MSRIELACERRRISGCRLLFSAEPVTAGNTSAFAGYTFYEVIYFHSTLYSLRHATLGEPLGPRLFFCTLQYFQSPLDILIISRLSMVLDMNVQLFWGMWSFFCVVLWFEQVHGMYVLNSCKTLCAAWILAIGHVNFYRGCRETRCEIRHVQESCRDLSCLPEFSAFCVNVVYVFVDKMQGLEILLLEMINEAA